MPEMMCSRCKQMFEYDINDIRPFIYHECSDGVMRGHKSPNNIDKPRKYFVPPVAKKKTVWQDFGE